MSRELSDKEIQGLVQEWEPSVKLESVEPITPDASLRSYYRVHLLDAPVSSAVLMQFHSLSSPEHSGGTGVASDEAVVRLTKFFHESGIAVPCLLFDKRAEGILLIEDLGELPLADVAEAGDVEQVRKFYQQAIDQLLRLQALPKDERQFVFQRGFSAADYVREMREFSEFFLPLRGIAAEKYLPLLERFYERLSEALDSRPKVLAHRDFHSWNLMVHEEKLRVIDFQDALLATPEYDLVSLLHDRDTDAVLGGSNYASLKEYYSQQAGVDDDFEEKFAEVSLQRDFKVVGRFAKLSMQRGLHSYEKWIPGTLRRIAVQLEVLSAKGWQSGLAGEVLQQLRPEIEEFSK